MDAWLPARSFVIQFAYGLSFFSLGLLISAQYRSESRYKLASGLWALMAFAFIHAAADWGPIFIPVVTQLEDAIPAGPLWGVRTALSAISFGFLLHFGMRLLGAHRPWTRYGLERWVAPCLTVIWLGHFLFYPILSHDPHPITWYWLSETYSRYMMGLPGGLLVAAGFILHRDELRRDNLRIHLRLLYASAACFALYGLTAGLVVPRQPFWPASIINSETIVALFGIPVEILRAGAAIGTALTTAPLLTIFNLETNRRLARSEQEGAILRERERIARDLHDGMLQTLYGVGLGLRDLEERQSSETSRLQPLLGDLTEQLSGAILDLRRSITNLRDDAVRIYDLIPAAREVARQVTRLSGLPVGLTLEGFEDAEAVAPIPASFQDHVLALLREGLSNVARHSGADHAAVMLALQDDTLILRISDEGKGFDPHAGGGRNASGHHGLQNMASRADQLGGTFRLDTAPGRGTRLLFHIPVPESPPTGKERN